MVISSSKSDRHSNFVDQTVHYVMERLERESHTHMAQRAEPRHCVHAPAQLGLAERGEGDVPVNFKPLYHAWVTDVSNSGVGMLLEHDLPNNVIMWVNLNQ